MKKMIGITAGLLLFMIAVVIVWPADGAKKELQAEAASYYGTDSVIPNFPEKGTKGTDNNPFVILEIVPYEGYAEIGYMIDGCEPMPLNQMIFDQSVGGTLASTGGLSYEWLPEYTDSLKEGDVVGTGPGEWTHLSDSGKYRRYRNYFTSKNIFLKNALRIPDDQLKDYQIEVVTVTPDQLNDPSRYPLIDRADLIYLSPKSHYGDSFVAIWEKYHPDKVIANEPKNFYSNDLTWETAVRILKKAAADTDPAPVIFDVTTFSDDQSYSANITTKKHYSDGTAVTGLSSTGYTSNTAKLYLAMQLMDPGKFYREFIETGRVKSVRVKDSSGNPVVCNGIAMTTGYFTDLAENVLPDYYTKKTSDDAAVWSIHTFLPYELFADYSALNGNKAFDALGYHIFTYDGDQSHRSVRHGLYAYNGDNSITQIFLNDNIGENFYNTEAFDFYEKLDGTRPNSLQPAEAVYYLLCTGIQYQQTKLRILEIEPCNDFIWDGTDEYWYPDKTPTQDSYNGSTYAREYFARYFPHYSGSVKVVTMTSSEFIGKTQDLNSSYDLIFFGLKDGMLRKNGCGTTIYNDTSLNGKIYLHVGDIIKEPDLLRGTLGTDDTVDWYRYSGNDITAVKRRELKAFMEAGNPVILGDGFLTAGGTVNTAKIDSSSQIYQLASSDTGCLFYSDQLREKKLEQTLAVSKCHIVFGRTDGSLDEKTCYPLAYKDKTKDSSLTDQDIYINGESISNRTLQYRFYINDGGQSDKCYKINLYIDGNADGRFDSSSENIGNLNVMSEGGYAADCNNLQSGINYTLTCSLDESYSGILPWKLEIRDASNPLNRSSVTNYCALKAKDSDRTAINVLQIIPDSGNNLKLSEHQLIRTYTADLNDYIFRFKTVTIHEFEALCGNGDYTYILKDSNEKRNNVKNAGGTYVWDDYDNDNRYDVDLLVLGFADLYSGACSDNALRNIAEFIDDGKPVLFTHDTTSYVNQSSDRYTGTDYWGYDMNKSFRDLLGMDRFGVSEYNTEAARLAAGKDYASDGYIQGYTDTVLNRFAVSGQYLNNINFPTDCNTVEEYATSVNRGQITTYPYHIDDRFQVAATHCQYYQLDMESDDITVWYCLSDDYTDSSGNGNGIYSTTPNDARCNYYIYNKGNITYSGVGHSAISQDSSDAGAVMETKLLINTMLAAYCSAVKEPVINITNTNKSTDEAGMDYIYVDYDIYATGKAYGSDLDDSGQKVCYQVFDKNVLYNKKLTVQYLKVDPDTGQEIPLALETKEDGSDTAVSELNNGTVYQIRTPLDLLNEQNRGNTIIIRATLTYGESLASKITADKKFTLVRRGLFDLE